MPTNPIITMLMAMLSKIPKVVFILALAAMVTVATGLRQADAFRYWGVYNVLLSLVSISRAVTLRWFETRQLFWHLAGHMVFLAGVVFAIQTPEFVMDEVFIFFISTGLIMTQFPDARLHEDMGKDP